MTRERTTPVAHGFGPVLDLEGASEYLHLKPYSVRRLVADGVLPHSRLGPGERSLRFRLEDLEAYVRERTSTEYRPHKATSRGRRKRGG